MNAKLTQTSVLLTREWTLTASEDPEHKIRHSECEADDGVTEDNCQQKDYCSSTCKYYHFRHQVWYCMKVNILMLVQLLILMRFHIKMSALTDKVRKTFSSCLHCLPLNDA